MTGMNRESLLEQPTDGELYRHLMCSQGGLVLRIRLRAHLDRCPLEWLRGVALHFDREDLDAYPGVAAAFGWVQRKFGLNAAIRAVQETIAEIVALDTV
ncbi:MAG: hypothetical protein ACRDJO_06820 [Actinomycetota bacterium]